MNHTHVAVTAVTALLTAGVTAAAFSPASADHSVTAESGAAQARPAGKMTGVACNGKTLLSMRSKASDTSRQLSETATNGELQAIDGTTITMRGPASGTDTVLITFTAEASLSNAGTIDWMSVGILVDGNPVLPTGMFNGFKSDAPASGHSTQACVKIGPGPHTIGVSAGLTDANSDNNLIGLLDSYMISALRFN